jgi:UDP-4-amino-4,6-dideoxy-N-acetyl-beta-L-altrosamine N-acetyltransferase
MSLLNFSPFEKEYIEIVYKWRRDVTVSRYMLSDIQDNYKKHIDWFNKISQDKYCKYWIIKANKKPIGLINIASIDNKNKKLTAGYYIGEEKYRFLGSLPLVYIYNYIFRVMKFRKIYGEVLSYNKSILKIHEMHGYDTVGVYKDHIMKDDTYHDVVIVELLSEKWLSMKRYKNYITKFPT